MMAMLWRGRRLTVCLVTTALVATLVPAAPVYATAISPEALDAAGAEVSVEDGTAAEVAGQDGATAAEASAATAGEQTIEVESSDEAAVTADSKSDGEPSTPLEGQDKSTDKKQDEAKLPEAKPGEVLYIKRAWDGKKVTESVESRDDAQPMPLDGHLRGGWYTVVGDRAYSDRMVVTGNVGLILGDGQTLSANGGIYVAKGSTLTVYSEPGETGRLVATAKTGAGIGAYSGHLGGGVIVCSGYVEAHGGKHCAGIGSNDGDQKDVGSLTVYGGTVDAHGGESGAGIGGGRASEGGRIIIYGGTVTGVGDHYGAGIGGGNGQGHPVKGAHAGHIEIWGGTVTGTGGDDAAGIGGGEGGNAGSIAIHGGTVTGNGGNNGAGIGGGEAESTGCGGTIRIDGGKVHGKSGEDGACIGGGNKGKCTLIEISGGTVTTETEGYDGAGIGGGGKCDCGEVRISGGNVKTRNAEDGAGIGGGDGADGGKITITGGTVNASSFRGAAIGGGQHGGGGGTITIKDGNINTWSNYGAGIGGGSGWYESHWYLFNTSSDEESGAGGDITISGGDVTARALSFGIGAGGYRIDSNKSKFGNSKSGINHDCIGSAGTITIEGSANIVASGLIAGMGGDGGTINIKGGTVKTSGDRGSRISDDTPEDVKGSGIYFHGKTGKLNISGGKVEAAGNDSCAGIGLEQGGTVNITGGKVNAWAFGRPAIGSSRQDTPKGTLNISGRLTQVDIESTGCSAIGGHKKSGLDVHITDHARVCLKVPAGEKPMNVKSLELYDEARVITAPDDKQEAHAEDASNRIDACRKAGDRCVTIEECLHDDPYCTSFNNDLHVITCPHCCGCKGNTFRAHKLDDDLVCTECHHRVTPTIKCVKPLMDGRIGLCVNAEMPKVEGVDWSSGYMEFAVGKRTAKASYDQGRVSGSTVSFDCPLNAIEMADEVRVTYCLGDKRFDVGVASLVDAMKSENQNDAADGGAEAIPAILDYGHYVQRFLSGQKGWTIGNDGDHREIPICRPYGKEDVASTREALAGVAPYALDLGDTVSGINVSTVLDSEVSLVLKFKTSEEIESVSIDGRQVSADSVRRGADAWYVRIDGIRASQLAEAHDVSITTTGEGDTAASVKGVSVLSYARAALGSKAFEKDEDAQYAMVALCRYYQAFCSKEA